MTTKPKIPKKCSKCGSVAFFGDIYSSALFIKGKYIETLPGEDVTNCNCIKCNYPEQYTDEIKAMED